MQWLHQLPRHWQTTSVITYLLWPIELLYKLAWFIRRSLFALGFIQTHQLDATVIVVALDDIVEASVVSTLIDEYCLVISLPYLV